MPEPTPANALERMRRQVRAVRWRQNLHELQRALYRLLATLAAAAAALVVLGLLCTPGLFAAAAWGLGAGSVLLAAWIMRALGRRWLSGARAPLWIDRHARLEGRLATALELERHGGARAPFFPLLVDENARRLAAWRPERLVPEGMPSGAFAGALAAVGAFLLALLIAPWLQPRIPAAMPANTSGRIAIAGRGRPPAAGRRFAWLRRPDEDDSALSRLPGALQERIQDRLWGEDRERAREALERAELGMSAEREDASPPADRLSLSMDASDPEERWAIAPKPPPGAPRRRRGAAPRARRPPRPRRRAAARRARPQDERAARLRSGRERGVRPPGHGGAAVTPAVAEAAIRDFQESFAAVRQEIGRVVVGHEHAIDVILTAFFAGGHVLIECVPGIGKTLIVRSLAEALNLTFNRVQFTVDLMPADITGTRVINESAEGRREFVFVPGPVFAHILLADEINRATPKTQSALLEAMAEQQVTVAGTSYPLAPPFFVLATLNPIEMECTYQLPEAQLHRFLFKVLLDYPSAPELERILGETTAAELPAVRPVLPRETAAGRVEELKRLVRQVLVAPHMERHVAALVRATVPAAGALPEAMARYVTYGSSPRGGQALILGAKVMALLAGRPHITFEDVERVALPALRHRLVMSYLAEAAGVDAAQVVEGVLASARHARA